MLLSAETWVVTAAPWGAAVLALAGAIGSRRSQSKVDGTKNLLEGQSRFIENIQQQLHECSDDCVKLRKEFEDLREEFYQRELIWSETDARNVKLLREVRSLKARVEGKGT